MPLFVSFYCASPLTPQYHYLQRKIFYEDVEVDEEDEMETFLRDVVDGKESTDTRRLSAITHFLKTNTHPLRPQARCQCSVRVSGACLNACGGSTWSTGHTPSSSPSLRSLC